MPQQGHKAHVEGRGRGDWVSKGPYVGVCHPSRPGTKSLRQSPLTLDLDLVPDSTVTTVFPT